MSSIIFLETYKSGSSRDAMIAAKKGGYQVHLLTSNPKFLKEKEDFPDIEEIHLVNFKDLEQVKTTVLHIQSKEPVACIVSFIDSYVFLAASLSNEICGTALSLDALNRMEDKLLTRNHLAHDHSSPFFAIYTCETPLGTFIKRVKHKLPLIVKLPKSCGSKNVYLVQTVAQLRNRLQFLTHHFCENLLIEEYLNGPQVVVEVIVQQGELQIAAIVEQEITRKEKFIVTGYSISKELDEQYQYSLIAKVKEVLNTLELEQGNCHLEFRFVQNDWKLIEANPRMSGGVMNELIQEAYGFNYAEQILALYMGESPNLKKRKEETVYAHYLTVDEPGRLAGISGLDGALRQSGILKVSIKPNEGDVLYPPFSMGNRYGYILASGNTKNEAKNNALRTAGQIKFHLIPL